ncbi:hypothetical protein V499_05096 [Pseudogymnoascus sp. VKM F-103]|nr:hypothetical protein V499_05096 [Pseudogymnoascus sp. VKM F-103]
MKQKDQQAGARNSDVLSESNEKVCNALEKIANTRSTTLQAVSPFVFPIVGVQTVEHVKAMPDALRIKLSKEDIDEIQGAIPFDPLFPMNFLFNFKGTQDYSLGLTATHNQQYQMSAWIDAPPKQAPFEPHTK